MTAWVERVAKLEFYEPAQQFEDYFEFENGKIVGLRTVRLSMIFQRYKMWYAAAFPALGSNLAMRTVLPRRSPRFLTSSQ